MGQTVSEASIEEKIAGVYYINAGVALAAQGEVVASLKQTIDPAHLAELGLVTICIIVMKNGFKVEGTSACVDPSNYNEEVGRQYAYENAFEKLWELEGYVLKQKMFEAQ